MEASGQATGGAGGRLIRSHRRKPEDQRKRVKILTGSGSNYRPRFGPEVPSA